MLFKPSGALPILSALVAATSSSVAQAAILSAQIATSVEIAAPREVVWQVLTDFECYPRWNPFMTDVIGAARRGERLSVTMRLSNSARPMRFRPMVLLADGHRLRWRGRLLLPGLFDGTHTFSIVETSAGHVRLDHGERFSGLLLPFAGRKILRNTHASFQIMNMALKARAEQMVAAIGPTRNSLDECSNTSLPRRSSED